MEITNNCYFYPTKQLLADIVGRYAREDFPVKNASWRGPTAAGLCAFLAALVDSIHFFALLWWYGAREIWVLKGPGGVIKFAFNIPPCRDLWKNK